MNLAVVPELKGQRNLSKIYLGALGDRVNATWPVQGPLGRIDVPVQGV